MKNYTTAYRLRHTITFCLILAIFSTYTMTASALPDNKQLMGELIVSGKNINSNATATINGELAYSGRTFFSSGTITTPENTSATVKLGKLGFITLAPESNLSLSFSENKISGVLSAGQINVSNNEGVEVNIQTPDSLVSNELQKEGTFSVDLQTGTTNVLTETGTVYMNNGTTTVPVKAAQDDADKDGNSSLAPLIVLGGLVAAAIIYVAVKDGNDDGAFISPRR